MKVLLDEHLSPLIARVPARRTRTRDATGYIADAVAAIMLAHPRGIPGQEHWLAPPQL